MASSIASSFVEVYKATVNQGSPAKKTRPDNGTTICRDIFEAAKRGDLEYLRHQGEKAAAETAGADGAAQCLFARTDDAGHTAAHWASLNCRLDILRYLAGLSSSAGESRQLCNLASEHELGQRPIHWACVNGHVQAIEFLLDAGGASIDQRDAKGATPLLVACQYGQTVAAAYLMGRGAALTVADNEGDTTLHWAAFKGQADLVRLLVYAGCEPQATDAYGQTPLHFACIGGSLQVVRDFCRVDKASPWGR